MKRIIILMSLLLVSCSIKTTENFMQDSNWIGYEENNNSEVEIDGDCTSNNIDSYFDDVEDIIDLVDQYGKDFSETENKEQAKEIIQSMDEIFEEVFLWKIPNCANEVHISVLQIIIELRNFFQAMVDGDPETADKHYLYYAAAVIQYNEEASKLFEIVQ